MMPKFEQLIATVPERLEAEFVFGGPDESIKLAEGVFECLRDGKSLGTIEGELRIGWFPSLQVGLEGETELSFDEIFMSEDLRLFVPSLGLEAELIVTKATIAMGRRTSIRASLNEAVNGALGKVNTSYFYLVNFPFYIGTPIRSKTQMHRGRLQMKSGDLRVTLDRIDHVDRESLEPRRTGGFLTHVAKLESLGRGLAPAELLDTLDALYWLFAFMRGARTGPVLPSTSIPFLNSWVAIAPWRIDYSMSVASWFPTHSPVKADELFDGFLRRWRDPDWREGLRTTISWYVTANAPNTPNEGRVPLCQISLEVLAALHKVNDSSASARIRRLLSKLGIQTVVPARLNALHKFANLESFDAPQALAWIRNKLEHPTDKNRRQIRKVDGVTLMQAAKYGLELVELVILATLGYRRKYAMRFFQGAKGNDEVAVPWK